jgi:hypothetical protein
MSMINFVQRSEPEDVLRGVVEEFQRFAKGLSEDEIGKLNAACEREKSPEQEHSNIYVVAHVLQMFLMQEEIRRMGGKVFKPDERPHSLVRVAFPSPPPPLEPGPLPGCAAPSQEEDPPSGQEPPPSCVADLGTAQTRPFGSGGV